MAKNLSFISLSNESEIRQWDAFVKSHPNGTPFHIAGWIRTIQETYSFKPLLFVSKNRSGEICGVFPCFYVKSVLTGTRIISLPFSDYCGPLFYDKSLEREVLLEIIKKNAHQIKYMEIRGPVEQDSCFICHNYYKRTILNLNSDFLKKKKTLKRRTIQYSIRKAKRNGVVIREENTLRGIEEFYRLNILTRKKHGIPHQPMKFFKKMFNHMISQGYGFILLAIYDSKVVAATIFFTFKKSVYYKYNASDPQYLYAVTPNHLLIWKAFEKAFHAGYRFFAFGRTSPENAGLMRYKEMWGGESFDLPYFYYPKIKGIKVKNESGLYYNMLTNIWQSLPNSISAKLGPVIYKYMA
ncbi:MAG: lipid II:glycine glycyltransferase FemX [bacterium]